MLTLSKIICRNLSAMKPAITTKSDFSARVPTFAGFYPAELCFSPRQTNEPSVPLQKNAPGCDITGVIGTLIGREGEAQDSASYPRNLAKSWHSRKSLQPQNRISHCFATLANVTKGFGRAFHVQESAHAGQESCQGFVASGRSDESYRRASQRSKASPPPHSTKESIAHACVPVEQSQGLLGRQSQTHTQAEDPEALLSLSGCARLLGASSEVSLKPLAVNRPLAVIKSYWADIASEELAEWYQPIYFMGGL